jgi:hypothetical protein
VHLTADQALKQKTGWIQSLQGAASVMGSMDKKPKALGW